MFDEAKLRAIIQAYKDGFGQIREQEKYKWVAVMHFQENWDIDAIDFPAMLRESLGKTKNLLGSVNFFPRRMIWELANIDPLRVKEMYLALFDESIPVAERIESFAGAADELFQRHEAAGTGGSHYQTTNAISTYLTLRYPGRYYIYKYTKAKEFAKAISYGEGPRKGDVRSVVSYFNMCNAIREIIVADETLMELSQSSLGPAHYEDLAGNLLVDDIVYALSGHGLLLDKWWPSIHEYNPQIDKATWDALLRDPSVFNADSLAIMKRMLDIGGQATCSELSAKYGGSPNYYNAGSSYLARRVSDATKVPGKQGDNDNAKWWPILYLGRRADTGREGIYVWRLRPELKDALMSTDLSHIPLYVKAETTDEQVRHWWLNANPRIWSFDDVAVGEENNYTLLNESGNKRRIFQNFLDAKQGDLIIGYESSPKKQVVALCRVSRPTDEVALYFEKIESFPLPLEYSDLKDISELEQMEYFTNPQGSLFKLTERQFDAVMERVREQNPPVVVGGSPAERYDRDDFLNEVYMSEEAYDSLVELLRRKKNVIIQGPPGVGKTFAALRLAYSMMGEKDQARLKLVQFHQSYGYEDFVLGYKPEADGFSLQNGVFYEFCHVAANNPSRDYFFIIDEINRGNLSKILGELLMLIEKDYRDLRIPLAYGGRTLAVPSNLHIVGLMNTADRSLALLDYALRRRFSFFDMEPAFGSYGFESYQKSLNSDILARLIQQISRLNREIADDGSLGPGFCIGHSYFCGQTEFEENWLRAVIEYDLIPMLREYWYDDIKRANTWAKALRSVMDD